MKKTGFSTPLTRLFTQEGHDAYELIHFRDAESEEFEPIASFECPDNWSNEAAGLLFDEAATQAMPTKTKSIEENTVPSWLWRHTAATKVTTAEYSAQIIFDRVVGAASYTGWKQGIFAGEAEARIFFDEARYALLQRFIAIEPRAISSFGLDWAYGLPKQAAKKRAAENTAQTVAIDNQTIDAIVGGTRDKATRATWQQALTAKSKTSPMTLHFTDVAADWGADSANAPCASLNLMAFRHNDGSVNIEALRHATRLLVILLDLHNASHATLALSFSNLAQLLMALALPYDSEDARTMAASLSAIITAESYATSAELAGLRGASTDFTTHHETVLRKLRNHHRAAYGDHNDYEKISVLPAPLTVTACPDLGLVAAARSRWDDALQLARRYGLRHTAVTSLTPSSGLAMLMESSTQGISAARDLTPLRATSSGNFQREINSAVPEALTRLGYNRTDSQSIITHILGALVLDKAPSINHDSLRACGFDTDALARIENYLPAVNTIRLAFTPWVLGEEFCEKILKISASKMQKPGFDLLQHLGFSEDDINAANIFCYGHGTAQNAAALRPMHKSVFASGPEISAEAKIRMAASVQSFISGDAGLRLTLPLSSETEQNEKLLLSAWRQGVKSIAIAYDASLSASTNSKLRPKLGVRKSTFLHTKAPGLPARKAKLNTSAKILGIRKTEPKSLHSGRSK